jgi:hypothetical protein
MQLRLRTKSHSCRDNPDTYGPSCATSQQCALTVNARHIAISHAAADGPVNATEPLQRREQTPARCSRQFRNRFKVICPSSRLVGHVDDFQVADNPLAPCQ